MEPCEIEKQMSNLIDIEAKRIINILLYMYKKKVKVNKAFHYLVEDLMKEEYRFFDMSLISKVTSLIPLDLMVCPTNEWVFVTEREYVSMIEEEKYHLIKKNIDKNEDLIQKVAKKIIDNYRSSNLNNKNILEILYEYIPDKKQLLDADAGVIKSLIESIIFKIDKSYKITNINPLVIKGL